MFGTRAGQIPYRVVWLHDDVRVIETAALAVILTIFRCTQPQTHTCVHALDQEHDHARKAAQSTGNARKAAVLAREVAARAQTLQVAAPKPTLCGMQVRALTNREARHPLLLGTRVQARTRVRLYRCTS